MDIDVSYYFKDITFLQVKTENLYTLYITSDTVNVKEFVEKCKIEYLEYLKNSANNKLYYFKYLGKKNDRMTFSSKILTDENTFCYETFDNIFNEHVEMFKNDMDRLKNIEYYRTTGLRRKKGYLFYGPAGCGKNMTVTAMALYDKRSILDISYHLIKENNELEELLSLTNINDIPIDNSKLILYADEIHVALEKYNITTQDPPKENNMLLENNNIILENNMMLLDDMKNIMNIKGNNTKFKKFNSTDKDNIDKLNIGSLLSLLDGNFNYDGLIFIGMTNYIEKIDTVLRRSFRLTPIKFNYLRKIDIINLMEKTYSTKLSQNDINKIPDKRFISPADLRLLCEMNEKINVSIVMDKLLDIYNNLNINNNNDIKNNNINIDKNNY
jgi:SpoVK/Ycf46/Vps4 family AAA+-type ATPase